MAASSVMMDFCKDCELDELKVWLDDQPNRGYEIINQLSAEGKHPISFAACLGRVSVVEELLERGAKPSCLSTAGYSPLHYASIWGHLSCVKVLLNAGSKTNIQSCHSETARDIALRYGHHECVKVIDKTDLLITLQESALRYKALLTDSTEAQTQLSKDDKNFFNRCCDDKLDWIEMNREGTSVHQIRKNQQDLDDNIKQLIAKTNLSFQ